MYRSISTNAIVIRRERLGEFHKSLSLLTADLGLITAAAYGAYRMHSRLRMGSEPFTWSRVQLYHNPVKRSYKVMELEIRESFAGLQRDLQHLAVASLWAEVVQKSYGAGEMSGKLLRLMIDSLRLLEASDARQEPYLTIQFLWRFLSLAGYQPDTRTCDRCGAALEQGYYAASSNAILCTACGDTSAGYGGAQRSHLLPVGALRYLDASQALPLERAVDIQLEHGALCALRDTLPRMVQAVLEAELASLRWVGAGR